MSFPWLLIFLRQEMAAKQVELEGCSWGRRNMTGFTCNTFVLALNLHQPVRGFRRKVDKVHWPSQEWALKPAGAVNWGLLGVSRAKKGEHLGSGPTNVCMIRAILLWYPVLPGLLASPCCIFQPDIEKSWGCWFAAQVEEGEGQPTAVPLLDTIPNVLCNLRPCLLLSRQHDTVPMAAEQYDLHEHVYWECLYYFCWPSFTVLLWPAGNQVKNSDVPE